MNFGILVASFQGIDVRTVGSQNPGVSNVLRVLGKKSAALVLVGDGLKGATAAWIGVVVVGAEFGYVTLFVAVVGHAFPIWHGFRGGKSVATAIGGLIVLAPLVGVALGVLWIVIVAVWKTASVASIAVMILVVPALWLYGSSGLELLWASATPLFVLVRHKDNIQRLINSDEQSVSG